MRLPESFCERTQALLGDERWSVLEHALGEQPTVSVRYNPWKQPGWQADGWQTDGRVPWCPDGLYLKERPSFTFDPLFHMGKYYVQEASSMFVSHVVRQLAGILENQEPTVLDMCAAPGGKSTAMISALPQGSLLFANEPIRLRANILAENLSKFGYPHVVVTNNYPKDYERNGLLFDLILCDVPCSGEGMFRKDAVAIEEWSEEHVKHCSLLQREIVESAWKVLRPGGFLIYSTCTFNREENEDNIRWMMDELDATPWSINIDSEWGIQGSMTEAYGGPCYRFLPGFTRGEGLFMAVMKKGARNKEQGARSKGQEARSKGQEARSKGQGARSKGQEARNWLDRAEDYELRKMGDTLYALPRRWSSLIHKTSLRIIQAGVALGEQKGKDLLPDHRLALSTALRDDAFPHVAVDYTQAISYLRREALTLEDAPRGIVLLTYEDMPLGFVKNLGNRANNLYPKEWRVRS